MPRIPNTVIFFLMAALVMGAVLTGCAGNRTSATPTEGDEIEAPLDSLRAKFQLTIVNSDGSDQDLDAVLFSVPGKRYRMELTGPMGIGVASMLWTEDGWLMTFPTEKLYMKGVGYMVGLLNDNSIPMVHIHQVAAFFEGDLLPAKFERLDSVMTEGGMAINGVDGSGRKFSYEMQGSHVVSLSYGGRDGKEEKLKFSNFREFEGKELPESIVFERGGKHFLAIKIKKVTHGKPFSGGTWKLNVPRSFKPVEQ